MKRRVVIICIMAIIAAFHMVRIGSHLEGKAAQLYQGYFSDLIIPFGGYFLLCAAERQISALTRWEVKLSAAFLIPSIAETCQYFGIPLFGATFDPLDFLMYIIGAGLAAICDRQIFSILFDFWNAGEK